MISQGVILSEEKTQVKGWIRLGVIMTVEKTCHNSRNRLVVVILTVGKTDDRGRNRLMVVILTVM